MKPYNDNAKVIQVLTDVDKSGDLVAEYLYWRDDVECMDDDDNVVERPPIEILETLADYTDEKKGRVRTAFRKALVALEVLTEVDAVALDAEGFEVGIFSSASGRTQYKTACQYYEKIQGKYYDQPAWSEMR